MTIQTEAQAASAQQARSNQLLHGVAWATPKNTPTRNGRFVNRPYKHDKRNAVLRKNKLFYFLIHIACGLLCGVFGDV